VDVSVKTLGKGVTWIPLKTKEKDKPENCPAISIEAIKQVFFFIFFLG